MPSVYIAQETLDSLPDLGPDMRLREIQAFSSALSSLVPRIQADQEALEVVIREAPTTRFRQHLSDTHHHLTHVYDACERMMEVISSGNPEEIARAGRTLQELLLEAEQLNQATEEIMRSHSIASEEATTTEASEPTLHRGAYPHILEVSQWHSMNRLATANFSPKAHP